MAEAAGLAFIGTLGDELSSGKLDLPSFPDAAERVRRTLADPECCPERLARVIGSDAALAAQIIRMANSSAHNRAGNTITSLPRAVNRLGENTIRSTSVAFAMRQLSSMNKTPELREPLGRLWKHSVQVAAVAHTLARHYTSFNPDEAMLAGLVHDIGKLYILNRTTDFPDLKADESAITELIEAWHTGVGRAIVEAWDFPEAIAIAVDDHEELEREPAFPDLACVVLTANLYANSDAKEIATVAWEQIPSCKIIGVTSECARSVLSESANEIQSMVDALGGRS